MPRVLLPHPLACLLLCLPVLLVCACGDDSAAGPSTAVADAGPGADEEEDRGGAPVPRQALGCGLGEFGVLDVECGDCLCEACGMFMSACDDDCWRLLGCLVRDCDHDPNDPQCASALCTSFIGAAGQLQGFADCSAACKATCDFGP